LYALNISSILTTSPTYLIFPLPSLCSYFCHFAFCGATYHSGLVRLFVEVPRSRTIRHKYTPGRNLLNEWSARHRSRYLHNTTNTVDKHPDSKPRSQHSGCRRPTPYTARPPRSTFLWLSLKHSQLHFVYLREEGQNKTKLFFMYFNCYLCV